jgi:hypothetical protein
MAQPGAKAKAEGLGDVIGGLAEASAPAMVASGLYAPVKTAAAIGGGWLSQQTAEGVSNAAGISPEYSRLIGDVAAVPGAIGGARMASPRLGSALKAGVKAGGPDVMTGSAKIAGELAVANSLPGGAAVKIPANAIMGYPLYRGGKQIAGGLKKGYSAAREAWSPTKEYVGSPPDIYSPIPEVGGTPRPNPSFDYPPAGTRAPNAQMPPPVPRMEPEPRSPVGNPSGQYSPSRNVDVTATPAPMPPEPPQGGFLGRQMPEPIRESYKAPPIDPLLDKIARSLGGKSFGKLSPEGQATVQGIAAKMNGIAPDEAAKSQLPPQIRSQASAPREMPPEVLPPANAAPKSDMPPLVPRSSAPDAFMNPETTGVQNEFRMANRLKVVGRAADHIEQYNQTDLGKRVPITPQSIEAMMKGDPAKYESFRQNVGKIPGVSSQKRYLPDEQTMQAILDELFRRGVQ